VSKNVTNRFNIRENACFFSSGMVFCYEIEVSSDATVVYDKRHPLPNLFILDRQLQNSSDGLEACRYLKADEATRNIPVIMISATPEIGMLARKAGAEDYLEKPFSVSLLLEKIKKFLKPAA
jgi:CheY-like chemotaxis protein